jgi:hypothetical protein
MRKIATVALALALAACKVEKTGNDTYKVTAPTPEAKEAGQKVKEEAKELGAAAKEKAAEAAQSTGTFLQKAGENAQSKTDTTSTTTTTKTTTAGTTSTTSTHY